MARRRMIDPNIWDSEDVARMSVLARLLLIGMISNADDAGRGRANSQYLRAKVFPYDDIGKRDIERAVGEIKENVAITVYKVGNSDYYAFDHWSNWQRVDKPQKSRIPPPVGANGSAKHSGNDSKNGSGIKEREGKIKESGRRPHEKDHTFEKPSVEEVRAYCGERANGIDAQHFMDYQDARGWVLSNGRHMKDWKAAVRSWERVKLNAAKTGYEQHEYTKEDLDRQKMTALKQLEELGHG